MTDWSTERLDALPDCTVIEVWREDWRCWVRFMRDGDAWQEPGELESYESARFAGLLIRVVSVPVDALLSDETVWHSGAHPLLLGRSVEIPRSALRAAIAHVTGEAS